MIVYGGTARHSLGGGGFMIVYDVRYRAGVNKKQQ